MRASLGPPPMIAQAVAEALDAGHVGDLGDVADARAISDHLEPGAEAGVTRLHAGLAEMAVVEHRDREIAGLLGRDGQQAADPHQLLAVAGDHQHRALRLRQREAEPNHRRAAHRAPQIEIAGMLAGVEQIVRGGAEPGDHEQLAAVGKQRLHGGAAIESPCRC